MGRLDFYLHPISIAVIGASSDIQKVGHAVLRNIINSNFSGGIYPINPRGGEILGCKAFTSVLEVPDSIDVAVLCIPAQHITKAADECGQKGIKGIIVVAAGFREIGSEGLVLEQQLQAVCTRHSLRCVGPNALGNITTVANMSFSARTPIKGKIAMISQSGAMMTAILDWAHSRRIGFAHFISLGNKMDVDEVDFINEISEEEEISVIILYLESIENGEKFLENVPRCTRKKPIVILKSATSSAGKVAASSHTGALVGDDIAFDVALERAGIIRAHTMKELFNLAIIFDELFGSPPLSDKFAIVTNGGGPGIIATDSFERCNLSFAQFSENTTATLQKFLPPHASVRNPVDILGDASPERFRNAVMTIFNDPPTICAGVVVLITPQSTTDPLGVANVLIEVHNLYPDRLIIAVFMGGETMKQPTQLCENVCIPSYKFPEPAAAALSQVVRYRQMIATPQIEPISRFESFDGTRISQILSAASFDNRLVLSGIETSEILTIYGVNHPEIVLLHSEEEIKELTNFPVVMKISSPDILHKSDCGGIKLGVISSEEAVVAYKEIIDNVSSKNPRILGIEAQRMIVPQTGEKVTEIIIGVKRDPYWGPIVMVGSGGIYAEFVKDVAFELGRGYSRELALAQLQKTRISKILEGVRGEPPSDIEAVLDLLEVTAHLAVNHPDIASLDINPVLVFTQGLYAIDVKILLQ
jgi:acetyltransferase